MELSIVDIVIILLYFVITIFLGFYFKKLASKNIDSYFLGGRRLPWYILSVSNASGMWDVSGTMWLVSILAVYGLKGIWFAWLWPFFNQIFLMIYLSIWLRRSNVLTGAEWITTRFGDDKGARLSHIIVVIFALVSVLGFLSLAFIGIGKFMKTILPWNISSDTYAIIIMILTGIYVIMGGMFSVVATDVLQYIIMVISSVVLAIIVINMVSPDMLSAVVPETWGKVQFGLKLDLNWSGLLDSANKRIENDGVTLFGAFVMMMLFKGILVSGAGPIPSQDMQRVLSNRTPKKAAMMNGLNSVIMIIPRYLFVATLTVLALVFFNEGLKSMGDKIDFELTLPYALGKFIPSGLKGLLVAGLLAAFMSTLSAYINLAPAYMVNDIYKKYINPKATDKKYVFYSRLSSVIVLIIGICLGMVITSINAITQWLVTALWSGYAAPNLLKWYWWRFNGYGFFAGMLSGLLSALVMPLIMNDVAPIYHFPFIFVISLIASVVTTLLTEPEKDEVSIKFYKQVRPWGFWSPIYEKVKATDPGFLRNTHFKRDMFNVIIGIIWQLSLVALPVYIIVQDITPLIITITIILISSIILKKNWYDKLEEY